MAACAAPPQAPSPEPAAPRAPAWPDANRVTWVDLEAEGPGAAAWYAAAEWTLAQQPWVVPRVQGVPPLGFERVLEDGARTFSLRRRSHGLEICGAWAGCEPVEDLAQAQARLGLPGPVAELALSSAERRDAATLYDLGPARRRARGETTAGGLWVRARRQARGGAPGRAVAQLQTAVAREPANPALQAALAGALGQARRAREAQRVWRSLVEQSPFDPRFEAACAHGDLAAGSSAEARARIQALPPRLRKLPPAAAVLAGDPIEEVGSAGSTLRPRPVPGARALREGRPAPQEILRALEGQRGPIARVVRGEAHLAGGDARAALRDADRALGAAPWLPEALALRASALDALGRHEEAAEVRADLRYADPGSAEGPRRLPTARDVRLQSAD